MDEIFPFQMNMQTNFVFIDDLTNKEKSVIAGFAGFVAAFVSNPFELLMVRKIYDISLPKDLRRNYTSAIDGVSKVVSTEGGAQALWKGVGPTALKAVLLNVCKNLFIF